MRARGLKTIHGDIVIDNTAFSLPPEDPGEFDGRPNRAYNVVPDALMVNFQSIEFRGRARRAVARRVDVIANPAPANLLIENHVRFAAGRCGGAAGRVDFKVASAQVGSGGLQRRIVAALRGTRALPACCCSRPPMRSAPSSSCGGNWAANSPASSRRGGARRMRGTLLSFDSLSLGEIVRLTNKFSNNLMARHLLLTMGAEHSGTSGDARKGRRRDR